jgi:energy-coupling factor transporter ATP-binding protein EcfA2
MAKIAEIVKVQSGYANFVNLREALAEESENTDRMAMYRPTKAHRVAMERLSRGLYVPNEKKFYLLSGSYGTGKSHLCLMLANLLGKSSDDPSLTGFYNNYAKLDAQRAKELKNVRTGGQFLVVVCDYGSGRKFEDEVLRSIVTACEKRGIDISAFTEFAEAERLLAQWEKVAGGGQGIRNFFDDFTKALVQVAQGTTVAALRANLKQFKRDAFETFQSAYEVMQGVEFQPKSGNLVSIVRDLVRSAEFKAKFKGIAVFYDEFGTAVLQGSRFEAAVMQSFMEELCQHEANVLFIGCIHKSFKDYAERTNQTTASVMEARLTQVSLANEGIEEIIGAIVETQKDSALWGQEIKPKAGIFDQLTPQCASLKLFPWITDTNRIRERVLEDIYGMHPVALHCLLKLSSEIGSDVRSTFTFFSGGGEPAVPGSYSDFIQNSEITGSNGALNLYLADQLYLFFKEELSPSSRDLLDIQRNLVNGYVASLQALRKMEKPELLDELKDEKIAVLRTILIYALCGLPASLDNIEFGRYCISKSEKKQLKGILSELDKAGAIYLRRTSNTYELCATEGQDPVTLIDNLAEQPETIAQATVSELIKQCGHQEDFLLANGYNLPFTEDKRLRRTFVRGRELGPELWDQLQVSYDKAGAKYGTAFEGHAVYAICEDDSEVKMAREAVKSIPAGNILVAVPHDATPFCENLKRVIASRHLLSNEEASKYPAQVIARIRDMLDNGMDDGYLPLIKKVVNQVTSGSQSTWYQAGGKLLVEKPLQSHKPADMFCEAIFTQRCQIKHPDVNLLHDEKWQRNSNTPLKQAVMELLNTASDVQIDNGNPDNHGEKRYLQKVLLNGCGALKHLRNNGPVTEFFVESDPDKIDAKFPVLKELIRDRKSVV